jgi:hypothetical protein
MNYQEEDDYTRLSTETNPSFEASHFGDIDAPDDRRFCAASSKQVPDQQGVPDDTKTTRSQQSSVTSGPDADKPDQPAEGKSKAERTKAPLPDRR